MNDMTAGTKAETQAEDGPLFAARRKIYPQKVSGTYRRIKWIVLFVTLGIYYFLPFVRWDRGPNAPSQAVLVDFPSRRFYFFFVEIWPQEFYYLTGLLVLAALILFLMNALAGRVWCGYLCPQTVWTDLFLTVERWIEGDRRERLQKDKQGFSLQRFVEKLLKHSVWLLIAWWTGGAWVLYFADAPTLVKDLATFQAPMIAYAWIGILTFTTYLLAGHLREQVCLYMCPWPRIQAALTDEDALNVTYRYDRGEPRGSAKKNAALREQGLPAGDCVDCFQCVNVCPTGVDIRNGPDLGCIQCGLCIDACDTVMEKIGKPTRLIAYDTDLNIRRRMEGKPTSVRIFRMRTMLYLGLIALVSGLMLYAYMTRQVAGVSVIHDRNPIFVRLSDGSVRNAYAMRVLNKEREPRRFALSVEGLERATVEVVGDVDMSGGRPVVEVGPDRTQEYRVLVTVHGELPNAASLPVVFRIVDVTSGEAATASDHFKGP